MTQTVWLIGPSGSGKTSLWATAEECVKRRGHAFRDLDFRLDAYAHANFLSIFPPSPDGAFVWSDYAPLAEAFQRKARFDPSTTAQRYVAAFEVFDRFGPQAPQRHPFILVDAPGSVLFPRSRSARGAQGGDIPSFFREARRREDLRAKLLSALQKEADAVILVLPLDSGASSRSDEARRDPPAWDEDLRAIVDVILSSERIRRVAVTFSKYEWRFLYHGSEALRRACDEDASFIAIEDACDLSWLRPLDDLSLIPEEETTGLRKAFGRYLKARIRPFDALKTFGRDVRFMPSSAFGFLRDFNCPNLRVRGDGEDRPYTHDEPSNPSEADALRNLWRPFCTVDPFVFAVLGAGSDLMAKAEPPDLERLIIERRAAELQAALSARTPRSLKKLRSAVEAVREGLK